MAAMMQPAVQPAVPPMKAGLPCGSASTLSDRVA
jgi:hypothetical protein